MSERKGFFARLFGGGGEDEGETRMYSAEELGTEERRDEPPPREIEQHPYGFTVERAAEIIDDLPPDVSPESAVRIVRGTLTAAGIKVEDLERSTRARETKLRSEIGLARGRQEELKERADEVIRSLQDEIRKAEQARDNGIKEEEGRISRANTGLEDIKRVRRFFDFPVQEDAEETTQGEVIRPASDDTQVFEPFDDDADDVDQTRVLRRPSSLSDADTDAGQR
ncbi:hypothetical protein GBA65_20025 [Rubrobacter marinus]|uniref:Uncharacterized protein n=1 Tax=Rubrobacter marinus TaxID=2653852 RepID=A0A6G8Q1S9_9ACTN|nr:hypothetical protein [Rubrobacter marinus]QIN80423.1 hypothetical protein GBA65_20025 [Rubrobacter marinus]